MIIDICKIAADGMSAAVGGYGNSNSMYLFHLHSSRSAGLWKTIAFIAGTLVINTPHQLNGAEINARSPAFSDVATAIGLAKDGDVVVLPAGTANWSSTLVITKGITLQGQTTITGAGTSTATATDRTIIKNDVANKDLIHATVTAAQIFRITGFTFQQGLGKGPMVHFIGSGGNPVANTRIDNCHFISYAEGVWSDGTYGVADHCFFEGAGRSFFFNQGNYGGATLGNGAWADYPWYGTNKFFFVEDCTMKRPATTTITTSGNMDGENGARYVARHNDFTNCRPGQHGTEGGNRGVRAVEFYNNAFHWTTSPSQMLRSGVAFWHDNTWSGTKASNNAHSAIAIFRVFAGGGLTSPFGVADGTGPFDRNDTEGNGTFIDGHAPHVYDSGVVTTGVTGTGGTGTFADSSKNWIPGQWIGYSVKQTNSSAPSYPKGSYITGNTSNTITYTYYNTPDRGPLLLFAAGDTYKIHKLLSALDQAGAGKGDLLAGTSTPGGIHNTVSGHTWAHQALEPAMSWNNVHSDGSVYGFRSQIPTEVEGRDYYNLGKGLPNNGAPTQVTSIYKAALNGVDYMGPYTYPHPLTGPAPPTNLSIVSGP